MVEAKARRNSQKWQCPKAMRLSRARDCIVSAQTLSIYMHPRCTKLWSLQEHQL